jgi:hypothetical protein
MNNNFRLTSWDKRVNSRTIALNTDDALIKLAAALGIAPLELCSTREAKYRLERVSKEWVEIEENWDVHLAPKMGESRLEA